MSISLEKKAKGRNRLIKAGNKDNSYTCAKMLSFTSI